MSLIKKAKSFWRGLKPSHRIVISIFVVLLIIYLVNTKPVGPQSLLNVSGGTPPSLGGGGGGGGGDGGTTIPDEGFQCTDCTANFFEGNAGLITNSYLQPTLINRIFPFTKPRGHWNCDGICTYNGVDVSDEYNCVIDPTDQIPEHGYNDITGEKPECWCLKKNPGSCNWYDANYGQGIDNVQCGGGCPPGQTCTNYTLNGKANCQCTINDGNDNADCGWKEEPIITSLTKQTTQKVCEGNCPSGQECKTVPAGETAFNQYDCECITIPPSDHTPCDQVKVSHWTDCWTQGVCPITTESCTYNVKSNGCECKDGKDCTLHLTNEQVEQAKRYVYFDFLQQIVAQYPKLYCYGTCSTSSQICGLDTSYGCLCSEVPIPSPLPVGGLVKTGGFTSSGLR